jgi:hypothetical protein
MHKDDKRGGNIMQKNVLVSRYFFPSMGKYMSFGTSIIIRQVLLSNT